MAVCYNLSVKTVSCFCTIPMQGQSQAQIQGIHFGFFFFFHFILGHKLQQSCGLLQFHIALVLVNLFENHIFQLLKMLSSFVRSDPAACAGTGSGLGAASHVGIFFSFHSRSNQRLVYMQEFLTQLSNSQFPCYLHSS